MGDISCVIVFPFFSLKKICPEYTGSRFSHLFIYAISNVMIWMKQFDVDMPAVLAEVCTAFTINNAPEAPWQYKSVRDSSMWNIWMKFPVSQRLAPVRSLVNEITGLNLDYPTGFVSVWRYDENFPVCPVHIDGGGAHTGSVVTCISGDFSLRLHSADREGSNIVHSVDVTPSTLIALNNSVFPHSVAGSGDLIVFGVDKRLRPQEYFA